MFKIGDRVRLADRSVNTIIEDLRPMIGATGTVVDTSLGASLVDVDFDNPCEYECSRARGWSAKRFEICTEGGPW